MKINVGNSDRIIRAILGTGLIVAAVVAHGPVRWIGLAGIVLVVTAIVRFCPAYWVMRIRTLGSQSSQVRTRP